MKRNLNLGSAEARAKKKRLFWVRFYIILFFILAITFSLAIFSGHPKVIINQIEITGNAAVSDDQILTVVNKNLAGRYFYLFAQKNYLIFPRFRIQAHLLDEFKTLKEVEVSWGKWGIITVEIAERKPHSVWCGSDPELLSADCYFIDRTGYIFSSAPTFSGNIFVKNYSLMNASNTIDQYFLEPKVYGEIYALVDILGDRGLAVRAVYFDNFDFKFYLETGPIIIFNQKNSLSSSFSNLFTAINSGDLDLTNEVDKINYIDLRFDNKILVGKK